MKRTSQQSNLTSSARPYKKTRKGRDFWGPPVWATSHIFAATFKPEKASKFRDYLFLLPDLLPCDICAEHWKKNLMSLPLDKYLIDNHSAFLLMYILHDRVNEYHNKHNPGKPAKKSPRYEDVKDFYFRSLDDECKQCMAH
jgi:hypothetical protein